MAGAIQYPRLLLELADELAVTFERNGQPAASARQMAKEAVEAVRRKWGGLNLYIPKGSEYDASATHEEIYRAWKAGVKVKALAAQHGVSQTWVYGIINRLKERDQQAPASHNGGRQNVVTR